MELEQNKSKNAFASFLVAVGSFIAIVYAVGVGIFALVFNWQYANQNGFISWLLFGEIVATLKAIFWPFFVFF